MILEPADWLSEEVAFQEAVFRVPLPEPFTAIYGDSAEGRPSSMIVRAGEATLRDLFRYFEVDLIVRRTGDFVLVDRIE